MQKRSPYKVLIVAPSWVGDIVMSQALFKQLKRQYQDSLELHVLANSWTKDILSRMEEVNQVIENPFLHKQLSLFRRFSLGLKLRVEQYDEVFVLPNSLKSAIVPFFARIKKRTGYVGEFRYGLLNNIYRLDRQKLPRMVDRFCALGNNGSIPYKIESPKLNVDFANQYRLIQKYQINLDNNKIIAFCPGAEYGIAKRWFPEYFAQLANMLQQNGCVVIILGSNNDYEIGEEIVSNVNNQASIKNLCGKTALSDVIDLLSLCRYVVTNDSGLMHVGCALDTKVIAIYGSSSPQFTPPLSFSAQVVSIPLECSPCFKRVCQYGHYNCMRFITPDVIYNRISL